MTVSWGLLWVRAGGLWTHTAFTVRPPAPPLREGSSRRVYLCRHGSQRESVGGCRKGREAAWAGVPPRTWRGQVSVVFKERQEVIVTIARQVRGIQVGEELVGICEFWKELEKKDKILDEGWAEGPGTQ